MSNSQESLRPISCLAADIHTKLLPRSLHFLEQAHQLIRDILKKLLEGPEAFGQYNRLCRRAVDEVSDFLLASLHLFWCVGVQALGSISAWLVNTEAVPELEL